MYLSAKFELELHQLQSKARPDHKKPTINGCMFQDEVTIESDAGRGVVIQLPESCHELQIYFLGCMLQ